MSMSRPELFALERISIKLSYMLLSVRQGRAASGIKITRLN